MHKRALKPIEADLILVFVTMWWGLSYVGIDYCLQDSDPITLNAFRFIIGTAVVLPFGLRRIKAHLNYANIRYGIIIGISLFFTYLCATYGVKYTSISNAGFLCALAVILTPALNRFLGKRLDRKTLFSIVLCFAGICLLTLNDGFGINSSTIKGDILCIMCSAFYAINILLTENAVKHDEIDAYTIGFIELFVVGIIDLALAFIFSKPQLPSSPSQFAVILFLAIFCTGMPFVLQPIAQQYTSAARVGIIFTLEPVFNVLAAIIIVGEQLSVRSYLGGAIMVFAIIIMETDFKRK